MQYVARVTDEDATKALIAQTQSRDAIGRVGRQLQQQYLMPWMRAYAEWLTLECVTPPKTPVRQTNARRLSRCPVSREHLRALEQRADFMAYCEELAKGPLEQARARFASRLPDYVDSHYEALDLARTAKDYNAMGRLAEPALDRVFPKKAENVVATQVTITLSPAQTKAITSAYEAPPLLVSEVVPEPAADDDSDAS